MLNDNHTLLHSILDLKKYIESAEEFLECSTVDIVVHILLGFDFFFQCIMCLFLYKFVNRYLHYHHSSGEKNKFLYLLLLCPNTDLDINKNNNSIKSYTQKLSNATQKLLILMKQNFNINIKENTNIYCPFHEKESISNSPSAKFYFDTNTYACFSTNCPLKKSFIRNKANSYKGCVCINSVSLLNRIETLISRCTQRSGKLRNTGERLRSWRYST